MLLVNISPEFEVTSDPAGHGVQLIPRRIPSRMPSTPNTRIGLTCKTHHKLWDIFPSPSRIREVFGNADFISEEKTEATDSNPDVSLQANTHHTTFESSVEFWHMDSPRSSSSEVNKVMAMATYW